MIKKDDKCFVPNDIFTSDKERDLAQSIALRVGTQIEKNAPLGYDEGQLLIVFKDNCPNNTLPIIWSRSKGKTKWAPLFKRYF